MRRLIIALLLILWPITGMAAPMPVTKVTRQADGILFTLNTGMLRLQVWSDNVIRVTYSQPEFVEPRQSFSVVGKPSATKWEMRETGDAVFLETPAVHVRVDRAMGFVAFLDNQDKTILQAADCEITPEALRQSFLLPADEGIYGLGQHQQGIWNYRGHAVRLLQENREVGIPVILSSKGYTLLWDNPAVTEISVGAPLSHPATQPAGRAVPAAGAGENVVRWSSETGKAIDYYFINGPTPEGAIHNYRTLTGDAPLMPKWLLGFWQCKERYRTQVEVLSIAKQYRDLNVPIDGIIQDWRYWPDNTWGSHTFDKARYPDAAGMTKALHDMHYHVLISVWPKFDLGTANFDELEKAGAMFDPVIPYVFPPGQGKWYDPFSAQGREIYWKQISRELFTLGFDGWWLDAPEPELSGKWGEFRNFRTSAGPGSEVFNAYPLMHSTGIYQGQRTQTNQQRVVILTRSAYAGQQRNSAITWSGDIGSSWQVFQHQIPAGLNFSVSGIPYWNTDIGGFSGVRNPSDPRYGEIFSRWFQFGSFCPMFRVHGSAPASGTGPGKEFWRFDEATQRILRTYLNLRYRLLPYTYSVTWQVTHAGSTIMRPLVMDFADDREALNIGDQYLFGPSIMVNPVTMAGATSRKVYLPGRENWYDFWTGATAPPGWTSAAAPIETIPLFIRAGAILPMGPIVQYSNEKPDAPQEIRVYRGADGAFTLYEDEGDNYNYEKGAYSTIPLIWNEKAQTLTIGQRTGQFAGMFNEREFRIVFAGNGHGAGVGETAQADQVIHYAGNAMTVKFGG